MKIWKWIGPLTLCLLVLNLAQAKPKKPDVSAMFENAHYVYVESMDGDLFRPDLFPEDRQAITNVQDSLRDWKRYALTANRNEAELVFVVRKGRLAEGQLHGGISGGPRAQPGQPGQPASPGSPQWQQQGTSTEIGARSEVGPPDDMLRVYIQTDGQLKAIVWDRSEEGGLDGPSVQLMRQLKVAVDRAYPVTPPAPKKP
jgi:hypothetical protein